MQDAELQRYLVAVKGEEPPPSSDHPRWRETESLARRLIAESKAEGALRAIESEPARKKRWDILYLTGLLREGLGEPALARDSFEVVSDKLMAAGDRAGVLGLLDRFRRPEPTSAAVRFLHFIARGPVEDAERIALLKEAMAIRPGDPELHAELSAALERTGDAAESREHRLRSIELRLEPGEAEVVGETFLRLIEEDLEHFPARVGRMLLRFAALVSWEDSEPLLDLALPDLAERAAGLLSWIDLAPVAQRVPSTPAARGLLAKLLRIAVACEPEPDAIVEGSGIRNPAQPIDVVSARIANILAFPPGAHVVHGTWGHGRVVESDGETLTLEFHGRAGHKMAFTMASRSLDRIPGDGLRVLAIEDPGRLRALADAGDSEVLVRAMRDMGREATAAQLRPRLEGALAGYEWAGYWKRAKDRLREDTRLDLSEAYRQVYRLAPEGLKTLGAVLPPLKPRAAVEGLGLIRRFLREHPDEEERLREHGRVLVKRWALDETLDPTTRAQALCYALAWGTIDEGAARERLVALIDQGLAPDDLPLSATQDQLLDLSFQSPAEAEFLWRAAESRLPRLRERARARLRELLGDRYARAIDARFTRPLETPALSARLIEHFAANPDDAGAPTLAKLLLATLRLLERDVPDGIPERLLVLLAGNGVIARRLPKEPLDEATRALLENVVLHWAGSERRLVPVLEALRAAGLEGIADAYESRRKARAQTLTEGRTVDDFETRLTIMSRPTYDRLEAELKRLSLELRTTIPAAIERARQLGDLRENAEYEAAKLKQASAAARVQELITLLERTRLLETLEIDTSRVGVGTETVLAPVDEGTRAVTYWILGDGDSGLGEGVLSYRAPLARPLLGKPVGAEVELELPDGPRRYRIESIAKRIPA